MQYKNEKINPYNFLNICDRLPDRYVLQRRIQPDLVLGQLRHGLDQVTLFPVDALLLAVPLVTVNI